MDFEKSLSSNTLKFYQYCMRNHRIAQAKEMKEMSTPHASTLRYWDVAKNEWHILVNKSYEWQLELNNGH